MTRRVGFFGPFGTFTEQALRTQPDLAVRELVALPHRARRARRRRSRRDVDFGFVPIENSIEGMVNFTQDALAFDHDLLIVREVVLDIEHCLVGSAGRRSRRREGGAVDPGGHRAVPSLSCVSTCRRPRCWRRTAPPTPPASSPRTHVRHSAAIVAAGGRRPVRARRASRPTSPTTTATRPGSSLVAREGVPAPTGHDRTALVVYQRADEPGSLISILQEFAARRINLSNLHQPPDQGTAGSATTASSSTPRATSPTNCSPTRCAPCTPSRAA